MSIDRKSLNLKVLRAKCDAVCNRLVGMNLDKLANDCGSFVDMNDLLEAQGNYRPSLDVGEYKRGVLADCYDAIQEFRGDERRAHRYGKASVLGDVYKCRYGGKFKWKLITACGVLDFLTKKAASLERMWMVEADPEIFNPNNPEFSNDIKISGRFVI